MSTHEYIRSGQGVIKYEKKVFKNMFYYVWGVISCKFSAYL